MMFILDDFIGENCLLDEWTDAIYDSEFDFLVRQAEECTSKENVQNYLSQVLQFLQSVRISILAIRAENDVSVLEEICRAFYNGAEHASEYTPLAHKLLTFANFPYRDKELCITLGVMYLSNNFRIWACRKCLHEIYDKQQDTNSLSFDFCMFIEGNWHPAMYKIQQWLTKHYAEPTLAKIYLHAFDLKVLSYYTRKFGAKTAYETMREYIKECQHDGSTVLK